jgi:hypothetical protein
VGTAVTPNDRKILLAVAKRLLKANFFKNEVSIDDIVSTLYVQNKNNFSQETLLTASKIITSLRKISWKYGQSFSAINCTQMRALRNHLVTLYQKYVSYKTRSTSIKENDSNDPTSIKLSPASLYLILSRQYKMFKTEDKETSYSASTDFSSDEDKIILLANFFKIGYLDELFKRRKLVPTYSFNYTNCYSVSFLGSTYVPTETIKTEEAKKKKKKGSNLTDNEKAQYKTIIIRLNSEVTQLGKDLDGIKDKLVNEEKTRADCGRQYRKYRKSEYRADDKDRRLYDTLKKSRHSCDTLYIKSDAITEIITHKKSEIFFLNKKLRGESFEKGTHSTYTILNDKLQDLNEDVVVTGIDPGIVTTLCMYSKSVKELVKSVQGYCSPSSPHITASSKTLENKLTAKHLNHVTLTNKHRFKRERRAKNDKRTPTKRLQRETVTRKIRTKQANKKLHSKFRKIITRNRRRSCVVTYLGNWNQIGRNIKGHTRRSSKPFISRIKSIERDLFTTVNEFRTTKLMSCCFNPGKFQKVRRDETLEEILGAEHCKNSNCIRRKKTKATTINRDFNGAKNISIAGLSRWLAENGQPLPPFNRKYHKFHNSNIII